MCGKNVGPRRFLMRLRSKTSHRCNVGPIIVLVPVFGNYPKVLYALLGPPGNLTDFYVFEYGQSKYLGYNQAAKWSR